MTKVTLQADETKGPWGHVIWLKFQSEVKELKFKSTPGFEHLRSPLQPGRLSFVCFCSYEPTVYPIRAAG